ncbi:cobalt-precorrin-6Y C(15)-methyltransferase [Candidatus Venteria ishoeyi]|uniref:Cobalt-precorrin-6Y C(15)-methyltransferase n=2 Tax=Candidatus Venteria ishoeyi TaxID=1899563 RepID=A0A1H6FHG1_9GAMM|nr:cobalt-precorrin-6Y C(15)-methyltransferase [Candidatus Venteria ishoeyi]
MYLDDKDSLGLLSNNGIFEEQEVAVVKEQVKSGDTVLDIGANIGYYTLIFAKLVGKQGKVFAFEPEPDNFALLQKNIEINGYSNIVLIPKAVSDKNEIIKLYLCEKNKGMHRAYNSIFCNKYIEIESIRIDDYFQQNNQTIDFIKMDIEGYEYTALQGMLNILRNNKNIKILTEFSPAASLENGIDLTLYVQLLTELGFTIYAIEEKMAIIEPNVLYQQLKIVKSVVHNLLQEVNEGKQEGDIGQITTELCKYFQDKHYNRPVFENFLCMRDDNL